MKVFITGASGYIGGSVAKTLIDAGHCVYGLVRNQTKVAALQQLGIKPVVGTLDDPSLLKNILNVVMLSLTLQTLITWMP